jgi:sec-independent protein translocase protein TatC
MNNEIAFFFEAKIIEYFKFFTDLYYICLITVYILIVATVLLNSVFITMVKIKNLRKFFYFAFLAFSTILTPPDIISQILLTGNLIFVYEILILKKAYNVTNFS